MATTDAKEQTNTGPLHYV